MSTNNRYLPVETLRGIACLLLVFYHVVGPLGGGLQIEGGAYRVIVDALVDVRMPLFTFISGFIYAMHSEKNRQFDRFIGNKVRRLIVPLLTVGVPITVMQSISPGVNKSVSLADALLSPLFPVNHFWFLPAIFLIFIAVGILNQRGILDKGIYFSFVLFISFAIFVSPLSGTNFLSIDGAIYLFPFFLTGMAAQKYLPLPQKSLQQASIIGVLALACLQVYLASHHRDLVVDRRNLWALATGTISCILLYFCHFKSRILAFVGGHSFAIYLFHTVFAVAVRVALNRSGVVNVHLFVLLELIAGIGLPVALSIFFSRYPVLASLFLGEPRRKLGPSSKGNSAPIS
jgi:Uncharacterized protein conserved in bacteria